MKDFDVHIRIPNADLAALFVKAATEHTKKAEFYEEAAGKMVVDLPEAEEGEWVASYGKSLASNVQDSKKGLLNKAHDHRSKAVEKALIAKYLPEGDYSEITADQLKFWGLV